MMAQTTARLVLVLTLLCLQSATAFSPSLSRAPVAVTLPVTFSKWLRLSTQLSSSGLRSTPPKEGQQGEEGKKQRMQLGLDEDDFDDFSDDDSALEEQMALEEYNDLKGEESDALSLDAFMRWHDVVDLLESGMLDGETLNVILEECGVDGQSMTFLQFKEVVDIINEVVLSVEEDENNSHFLQEESRATWLPQAAENEDPNEDAVKAMLAAMGMKKRDAPPPSNAAAAL